MANKLTGMCPNCGAKLRWKANVDSDDRVNFKWRYCDKVSCGFDERRSLGRAAFSGKPAEQGEG